MKFHVLGSGSSGNCSYLETDHARILIDCGFSYRETCKRLAQLGRAPDTIDAIFITHEHGDHIGGLEAFTNHHNVPVFATQFTQGAIRMIASNKIEFIDLSISGSSGRMKDIEFTSFTVPHVACQPVNFIFQHTHRHERLSILTDLGSIPPEAIPLLKGTNILSIEANYDPELLAQDTRPDSVKARITGGQGHLSNAQAAAILDHIQPERIILTHLSKTANKPQLAYDTFADKITAIGPIDYKRSTSIYVSSQDKVL